MKYTSVRITFVDNLTEDRVRDALTACGNHVACLEGGGGGVTPHTHVIFGCSVSADAIRKRLAKSLPDMIGNKCFSMKDCTLDLEATQRYIAKGDSATSPPRIFSHMASFPMDWTKRHEEYWTQRDQLNKKRTTAMTSKTSTLAQEALAHFRDKDTDPDTVMEWLADHQVKLGKGLQIHHLRAVRNAVLWDTGHKRNMLKFLNSDMNQYV